MKKGVFLFGLFLMLQSWVVAQQAGTIYPHNIVFVSSNEEIYKAVEGVVPGDTLFLRDGIYRDIQLIVKRSGSAGAPVLLRAENPGKVFFTGNAKVELRGDYLILEGIYFKDGNRNTVEWQSHGPGLVAIYGSHNRVTQCTFDAFDEANSAYITTSLNEDGRVPQHCRIDHCGFFNKITFDQVINLNNNLPRTKNGPGGPPMYHRVDHCIFSNPKKPGNAGGGIRVGYYRNDTGRCLIDSNLFIRQDSEPEIITSKSRENVYYANTILNCRCTLNLRHGDDQVAINNFFISTDSKFEYGGMFVWGSGHIIADNYFSLQRTIHSRGDAALYFNPGPVASEHAAAFNILVINNFFKNNNGYDINFIPLLERRRQFSDESHLELRLPYDIKLEGNVFYADKKSGFPFFHFDSSMRNNFHWKNNYAFGKDGGIFSFRGVNNQSFSVDENCFSPCMDISYRLSRVASLKDIPGVPLDLKEKVNRGITGVPLTIKDVGPDWINTLPEYAITGKLPAGLQVKCDRVINQR